MARFKYNAVDAQGQHVEAELDAASIDAAHSVLSEQGLTSINLSPANDPYTRSPRRLSNRDTEEVVDTLASATSSGFPLGSGLRAAAAESTSRRVAEALRTIASLTDQGRDLKTIMAEQGALLPPHVCGLVAAAERTRSLGAALDDLVEHHRATRDAWGRVLGAIAYPTFVIFLTAALMAFLPIFVIPQFKEMFEEFELDLPYSTQLLIGLSDTVVWMGVGPGKWLLFTCMFMLVVVVVAASLGIGTAWTQRFAASIPILGPMWHWSGAAAFTRLLAMLLEQEVPLSEAIVLAGEGAYDPDIRAAALLVAREVEGGSSFSAALDGNASFPATMVPFVRWGETAGDLADGLRTISDILLERVYMRAALLRTVSPPVVFLFVGLMVGFVTVGLFMPLVSLIQGLT